MRNMNPGRKWDERDDEIRAERQRLLDASPRIKQGEFVRFADGTLRRISHVHDFSRDGTEIEGVQTSSPGGAGWYVGKGYCSFSGSLYRSVPYSTLTLTDERMDGRVWFFHHDWSEAHNGVETVLSFRVWNCSENPPD